MAQSYKNQIDLAQHMSSSLYVLADDMDYFSEEVKRHIESLESYDFFSEEIDLYRNTFNVLYTPEAQELIVEILANVQYVKKQVEALEGVELEVRNAPDYKRRDISEFRFVSGQ
jgi:DNA-binding MarR family transcriptional regulator